MGGPSDLEQPRGLGSTQSKGATPVIVSGCSRPNTVLLSLYLSLPARLPF